MRKSLSLSLVLSVVLGTVAFLRADDRAAAMTLLERAIKAHGGEAALARTHLSNRKLTGVMTLGQQFAFTADIIQHLPDRSRATFELSSANQKIFLVLVRDGDKGWRFTAGKVEELAKEEVDEFKEEAYLWWVASLAPLREKSFDLATLPEIMIDGKPAVGLKVSRKGHEDVKLYFDQTTHLLIKALRRGKEVGLAVDKEYIFREHKSFEGVMLPTKMLELTNAKKFVDVSSVSYQFPSRVEDSTFAKP